MTRRLADFAAGLSALAALAALTVAPPLLLARFVGWPLPTSVPTLDGITHAARTGIDDGVIVNVLAVIAWAAWAQIALTVVVEALALGRNRTARPLSVLPGLQHSIGRLVATAALVITSLLPTATAVSASTHGGSPHMAAFTAYRTPTTLVIAQPAAVPQTSHELPGTDIVTNEVEPATVEVRRHDSYWAIAERVFGNGTRWRDIRDHNIGRVMPDGTVITADSETLHPGWQLNLPNGATGDPPARAVDPDNPPDTTAVVTAQSSDPSPGDTVVAEVEVERGDNFWTLAQHHLTDVIGHEPSNSEIRSYWLELIDANRDRLTTGDPNLILPGQHFVFPQIDGQTPTPPTADPQPATTENVDPVATDPAPADTTDPDGSADPSTTTANTTPAPSPESGHTNLPPPAMPAPTMPPPSTTAASSPLPSTEPITTDGTPAAADDDGRAGLAAGLGVASAGLAVGITTAVRRRRRRANHLHPDAPPPATSDTNDGNVLREAILAADLDRHASLTAALDQLAGALAAGKTPTRPRLIQHGTDHLDVLLTTPTVPAPNGWHAEANGTIWTQTGNTTDLPAADTEASPGWGPVAPLLVTLGRPDDSGSQLYLDIEAATLVCLTGDTDTALGVARSVVTELAYSPFAERINLNLVGDLHTHAAARLDRIAVHDTWDDIARELHTWAEQSHQVHIQQEWPNSFVARAAHDHDALTPFVVIAATQPDDPAIVARLAESTPAAVAVITVSAASMEGATVIHCEPDQLVVTDLGLACQPQTLTIDALEGIVETLDDTDTPSVEPIVVTSLTINDNRKPAAPDRGSTPINGHASNNGRHHVLPSSHLPISAAPYRDPPIEVLVRCLGDIHVEHDGRPLTAKQTAAVTYIALHQPVTIDRLEDAVWAAPSSGQRRKRLSNTVSECRTILGARNLPVATNDGRYTTAATVVTDIDLFDRRVAYAANQPAVDAIATLRGALELVTGPVFTYRSADRYSYTWVDLDNWVSRWEPKIAAVAQHVAHLCLDQHDPAAAIEVATHALHVVPTHTGLTETLMRAHHHHDDPTSIDAVYHAHATALEQLGIDDVATSTIELYEQLRRTRAAAH